MGSNSSLLGTLIKDDIKDVRVLMIGLDNSGKTELLYRLKLKEPVYTLPCTGVNVNVETLAPVRGIRFTIWNVGGGSRLMWKYYYEKSEAVIYVVDSGDQGRLQDAREALLGVLDDEALEGVPLLVLANKADREDAVGSLVVEEEFEL